MSVAAGVGRRLQPRHAGLGARRLWWGILVLVGIQMAYDLGQTIGGIARHPAPELVVTAWGVLLVAVAAVMVVTRALGDRLPNWMFGLYTGALAIVLVLDIAATWSDPDLEHALTVGRSATLALLIALPARPEREIVAAALGFTLLAATGMGVDGAFEPATMQISVLTLCHMAFTVIVAAVTMVGFRALVRREIERVLSRAALLAPRLTVGIDQSEQLARLDLAAESLLAAVAESRVQLPLNDEIARRAGALATELRLHLLESRSRTWLDLAIEESALLGAAVRVSDETSSAGLLGPRQRSALLSALWLLAEQQPGRRAAPSPTLVTISKPLPLTSTPSTLAVPIAVQLGGDRRSGFDPGVWEHFAQIGDYREAREHGVSRVEIHAITPVAGLRTPADR